MSHTLGVLALQGDFAMHQAMLQRLHMETVLVKKAQDLTRCEGLIIPGGESTTLTKLMRKNRLYEPICAFARTRPIMGTCAGAIMLASAVDDNRIQPLGLIDIEVARNAYGRQIDSFSTQVEAGFLNGSATFKTVFIRAPMIRRLGAQVDILMTYEGSPIMVRQHNVIALTFHPELADDPRIHQYFTERLITE